MDPTLKSQTISRLKEEIGTFPPRMKDVAKYVLDHPADFGLASIRETAQQIGVSTFTLVRTAQRLGFASYEEFREPFRHALVSTTEFADRPLWLDEVRGRGALGEAYSDASLNVLSVVQKSLERQSPEMLEQIVERLAWRACGLCDGGARQLCDGVFLSLCRAYGLAIVATYPPAHGQCD